MMIVVHWLVIQTPVFIYVHFIYLRVVLLIITLRYLVHSDPRDLWHLFAKL
jgi:hypothetical protein